MDKPAILPLHAYGWRRPAAGTSEQWMESLVDLGEDEETPVSVLVHVDSFEGDVEIRQVRDAKGECRVDDLTERARKQLKAGAVEYVKECRRDAANEVAADRAEQRMLERGL